MTSEGHAFKVRSMYLQCGAWIITEQCALSVRSECHKQEGSVTSSVLTWSQSNLDWEQVLAVCMLVKSLSSW